MKLSHLGGDCCCSLPPGLGSSALLRTLPFSAAMLNTTTEWPACATVITGSDYIERSAV